jgi:hypothetical protein
MRNSGKPNHIDDKLPRAENEAENRRKLATKGAEKRREDEERETSLARNLCFGVRVM